jgi:hypothetical protein
MRYLTRALIGAVLASAAGCGGMIAAASTGRGAAASAPRGAAASASHGRRAALTACAADVLALRPGPRVVPMTGEHAILYTLANRGPRACTVGGYPRVTLYAASGRALPFRYADGGGPYVTRARPAIVTLAPRGTAYLLVAKYRCDLGIVATAATIRLTLPVRAGQVFAVREPDGVPGAPGLSYCTGGPGDPGQLVTLSPVESAAQATTRAGTGLSGVGNSG